MLSKWFTHESVKPMDLGHYFVFINPLRSTDNLNNLNFINGMINLKSGG